MLNSIILEGIVQIVNNRIIFIKSIHKTVSSVETIIIPCFLNEHFNIPNLNSKVRVVGRLKREENYLGIQVEHIEMAPIGSLNIEIDEIL